MSAESIGQRIKRERIAKGLTQRELAEITGVGVPHISKVEADRENPSEDLLGRMAEVFGADIDELLLVARRLPDEFLESLATDPPAALQFLRTWDERGDDDG